MPNPVILLGGAITAIVIIAAAYYFSQSHEEQYKSQYNSGWDDHMNIDRSVVGKCSICSGDVSVLDGYQGPCNHFVHYTCAASLSRDCCNVKINWQKVCRECAKAHTNENQRQQPRQSLRNRVQQQRKCANCQLEMNTDQGDIRNLKCNHYVHNTCWIRMQNSAFSNCTMCTF